MTLNESKEWPVAVIGAGPVGLAAAAHLLERGERPLVLEAEAVAGAAILEWAHVRMFSPWAYNTDPASVRLLAAAGWEPPAEQDYPTGRDVVDRYLTPLSRHPALAPHLRFNARVIGVSRLGLDRTKTAGRERAPFVLRVSGAGREHELLAKAIIDASGTWRQPNPLGANGYPAVGEQGVRADVAYGIPDVLGRHRARYAGRRVLVVGSGHSAMNVLLDLAQLANDEPGTSIVWAVRRPRVNAVFGGGDRDELPERGRLGARLRQLVDAGRLEVVEGFALSAIETTAAGLVVSAHAANAVSTRDAMGPAHGVARGAADDASNGRRVLAPVDRIIAATGFRPDLDMLREVRLDLDTIVESPRALAPLIDPNVHSCGTVPPHGAEQLTHPESGFFIVGMKSYGRAPTFLLRTGYEQVRSVVAALAGDWESARRVELTLPETGVCSAPGDLGIGSGACCGTGAAAEPAAAAPVTLIRSR